MNWIKQPDSEGYYWVSYTPTHDVNFVFVWKGTDDRYRLMLLGLSSYPPSWASPEFKKTLDNCNCCDNYPDSLWLKQESPALPQ